MSGFYFSPRTKLIVTWSLIALAVIFLYAVRDILLPFIGALVTAYLLSPLVNVATRRTGLPRRLWVVIIYFLLLGGLFWGISQLIPALVEQINDFSLAVPGYLHQIDVWLKSNSLTFAGMNFEFRQLSTDATNWLGGVAADLGRGAPGIALTVFTRLLQLIIYLVSTFFFLMNAEGFIASARAQFAPEVLAELDPWLKRITDTLGAYVRGQLILVLYMMTATTIALTVLDVQHALVLGVMTGLVELIPFAGPYAAGAIAVLVAITQTGNAWGWSPLALGIAVVIVYVILRQAQDNLIGPLVIGRVIELNPVAVVFFALAGAVLAGVFGLLIAVPLAATGRIIFQFLLQKLREPGPRAIVPVSRTATWEDLARELHGLTTERAVLVAPSVPPALHDPATYRLITIVAHEAELDLALMTDDPTALALARQSGIATIPLPTDLHPAAIVAAGQPGAEAVADPVAAGTAGIPLPR